MKRLTALCLNLFLVAFAHAEKIPYQFIKDSYLFDSHEAAELYEDPSSVYYHENKYVICGVKNNENCFYETGDWYGIAEPFYADYSNDYVSSIEITLDNGQRGFARLDDLKNLQSCESIHINLNDIRKQCWVSSDTFETVNSKSQEFLLKKEPYWVTSWTSGMGEDWQDDVSVSYISFDNKSLYMSSYTSSSANFLIESCANNGKDLEINLYTDREAYLEGEETYISRYSEKGRYKITIHFDGDYLRLYDNDSDAYVSFAYTEQFDKILELKKSIARNETVDLSEIVFPRHADGTCDYDGNATSATENNDASEVRRLIAAGANVNAKDRHGRTALMDAAEKNSDDIAKLLLAAGADTEAKDDDGKTALMYAAANNAADMAKLLIDAGADIEAKDKYSETALMKAAAQRNSTDVARLLIAAGADVNAKDNNGGTALMNAATFNAADVVRLLIESGADVNAKMIYTGYTALMSAASGNFTDVAKLLIAAGADVNAKTDSGGTALMDAAFWNASGVAKLLLAAGADMNAKDSYGNTALMYAADNGATDVAALLIKSGADAPDIGKTAAVTENLRLRTDNRTTAEVVATLAAGTRVKILAVGRVDTIDGIASNWMRVSVLGGAQDRDGNPVAAGTQGWLFGGYLSSAEDAESGSLGGEADAAKAPALPIALVAAGGAVFVILLAAILLAKKKRKGGRSVIVEENDGNA